MAYFRFLFLFLFALPVFLFAQTDAKKIAREKLSLKKQGIDTIVCYSYYCVGGIRPYSSLDTCFAKISNYIFWIKSGNSYRQKFDECRDYPVTPVRSSFLKVATDSIASVKAAEIRQVEHYEKLKREMWRRILYR